MTTKKSKRIRPYLLPLIFLAAGGLSGYLYYLKIGCITGTCRITSNPLFSTLYGALFGYLIASLLPTKNKTSEGDSSCNT